MHSIVLQDTLIFLEVVEGVTSRGGEVGAVELPSVTRVYFNHFYSPELNVVNITLPVAISAPGRPNAGSKLAVTLTV